MVGVLDNPAKQIHYLPVRVAQILLVYLPQSVLYKGREDGGALNASLHNWQRRQGRQSLGGSDSIGMGGDTWDKGGLLY